LVVCSVVSALNLSVTAYTASYAAALVTALSTAAAVAAYRAPDSVFSEPEPAVERGNTTSEGMTDREVGIRVAIVNERNEYEQELAEEERKKAKREANRNNHGRQPFR
jgi:hypothetical protein